MTLEIEKEIFSKDLIIRVILLSLHTHSEHMKLCTRHTYNRSGNHFEDEIESVLINIE